MHYLRFAYLAEYEAEPLPRRLSWRARAAFPLALADVLAVTVGLAWVSGKL